MRKTTRNVFWVSILLITFCSPFGLRSVKAETEEQRLVRISKYLKPISDSQWNEIASAKLEDNYEIQSGDTLWDVSKRLFGNAFYWPKVWSLNQGITNPHILAPGQLLAFSPGTSEALPQLGPTGPTPELIEEPEPVRKGTPEYEKVSSDLWAPPDYLNKLYRDYDEFGLAKDLKVKIPSRFGFRIPALANDTTIPYLGEIVGSRRAGVGLGQFETVFLKSESGDLQIGNTYSILSEPEYKSERKSDRSGYIYRNKGSVKIIGVKDETFVGIVEKSYDVIERGDQVYPLLPMVEDFTPVAAANAIEGLIIFDDQKAAFNTAQYQYVFFDRGIEDGIQLGNVFRVYDYYDPETKEKVTDSDYLIRADIMIIHATAQFSTGLIIRSRDTVLPSSFGVLLTDVADFDQVPSASYEEGDAELDELDRLDRMSGEGIGREEEKEVKELDYWDKTKDSNDTFVEEPELAEPVEEPVPEEINVPEEPVDAPSEVPGEAPAEVPSEVPSEAPIEAPAEAPVEAPIEAPVETPIEAPVEGLDAGSSSIPEASSDLGTAIPDASAPTTDAGTGAIEGIGEAPAEDVEVVIPEE